MAFLELQHLCKRFPGVVAVDRVSFAVERGSCHALIGENGAGKSTLGKMLSGITPADAGRILLEGREIRPAHPLAARRLGIAMVHQELAFCPNLSVAENLCLGDLPRKGGWLLRSVMRDRARRLLEAIGADLDVDLPIGRLTTGQEQRVQIAAAVGTDARLLIMDEPTSSLSAHESEQLFELLGRLRRQGITVLYVSHRMEEIFRLCDRITVLRDGRHIATEAVADTDPHRVIEQMIGRQIAAYEPRHLSQPTGAEALRVEQLSSPGRFHNIGFSLARGEVLGFAGLVGAGRSEVAQAICGLDPAATGSVWIRGRPQPMQIRSVLKNGLGYLPEDRKRQGLVLSMNCRENISLAVLPELSVAGFVRGGRERALARTFMDRLRVKAPSPEAVVAGLSGGNQQKIALAKWLARNGEILIVDEPTRGVDVGAKREIHELLDHLACEGMAILLISSELPELMNLSRRILVLREGRITGELAREAFSQGALMRLMTGVAEGAAA